MLTFNFNNISPEKDSFMLDAGCGPGRHVFGFMDQFPDITCVGVDLDSDSLHEGKTNLTLFNKEAKKVLFPIASHLNRTALLMGDRGC